MAGDEGPVDLHERVLPRKLHGDRHEEALQARVDDERPGGGVHAGHVLRVVDVLLRELGAVEPVPPAEVLPDERDGHGGLVGVQLGHVEVVDKVDERLGARGPKVDPGLLLEGPLHDALEADHVGEVVEGDGQADLLLAQVRELALHQLRLAHAGAADKHDGLLEPHHEVQEEAQRRRLGRRHKHGAHGRVAAVLQVRDELPPRLELLGLGVDKVVVDGPLARKLDRGPRLLEPLVEVAPVVDAVLLGHAAAEGPDHRKDKVELKELLRRLVVDVLGLEEPLEDVDEGS